MQTGRFRTGSSSVGFSSTDSLKILLSSSQPCFYLRLDFLPFFCSGFRYWFLFILELMKSPQPRRKCLYCKELFLPDYRGGQRQCYCLKPDCRKARKRELMRAWLAKPENQDYFRDDQNASAPATGRRTLRAIGKTPLAAGAVPYKTAARSKLLRLKKLRKTLPTVPCKTSVRCKFLCLWGLSPCSSAVPYQTTSPPAPGDW